MNTQPARYAAWAAYITGIAGILGFILLVLFFAIEAPQIATNPQADNIWGPLSDIAGPAAMLPLLLVILALHQIERARAPLLSRAAAVTGFIGALGVTILQCLLIVHVLSFEQEVGPVVWANGIVGVWLLLANYLGLVQRILPSPLAWLGIAVGVSEVLYPVIFPVVGGANFYESIGSNYPVLTITIIIFLVSYIGFPTWLIGLGRTWSSRRSKANSEVVYVG